MSEDCLKLTVYFGERDRADGGFLADALSDIATRHRLRTSVVMRGVEGFGAKHQLRTDRLLTLSEDLPLVAVAVDSPSRIGAVLPDLGRLRFEGLVTLERARSMTDPLAPGQTFAGDGDATKLTVYVGRQERVGSRPAHEAVVDLLHERGVDGATVLLGVDGTVHGDRRRARFFARNAEVPLMIIAIGAGATIASLLPDLNTMLKRPLATIERVQICKRDGVRLAAPRRLPEADSGGLGLWQKLMVYAGEQSRHDGRPLSSQIVRELRRSRAAGTTSLRGIWGYHGDHEPHGDSFWQLRRRVPVVTVIVDRPGRIRDWFAIVDRLTDETGLVTSEAVPAFRATGPGLEQGGLRLAERP